MNGLVKIFNAVTILLAAFLVVPSIYGIPDQVTNIVEHRDRLTESERRQCVSDDYYTQRRSF